MFRNRTAAILTTITVAFLVLTACTPLVNLPGKPVAQPRIANGFFVTADGVELPVRSWLPPDGRIRAVVVALHGFNDYSNFFASPGTYLSRRGIASYAYDQRGFGAAPGHGLWSGIAAYTGDLSSFVAEIRTRHPGLPVYLAGESMGGAVAIVAMTGSTPPPVDGVILIAPAVWGRATMPWYQRWLLAVASHTLPWLELTGKNLGIKPSDNVEMLRALGRDPLVIKATRVDAVYGLTNLMDEALERADRLKLPTLVQYGAHDQVIPQKPTFMMLDRMPKTTRKAFYEGGYHMLLRDLQGEKPLADMAAWIADHNAPLPNGSSSLKLAGSSH